MEKIKITTTGVIMAVMILSSFATAQSTDNSMCYIKCEINCSQQPLPDRQNCVKNCEAHCKLSDLVYSCITSCHKSIVVKNAGAADLGNNLINTCMQECKKRF
ncbi:hypothetical protein V8G54_023673 [Vigna mungo]|uniref:Thionin-like protein 2 n=1 Tax=Vigna mungo TaxID=3915 RepID=A0AAQ3RQJ9_VIGMU